MAALRTHRLALVLALGVAFRLGQYLENRSLWLDESSLAINILSRTLNGLFGPLVNTQLAPPGFLVIEWLATRGLGGSSFVLRLFPLACGIASLFLFAAMARRLLEPGAVLIAVASFAVADDLIYYASELKQYSTDVALALVVMLWGREVGSQPLSPARLAAFAAGGALMAWFSHAVAFVLAGVGIVLGASALATRQWGRAARLGLMGLVWAGSVAGVYVVAREQLGHKPDMWVFWDFAFPRSAADVGWIPRRFIYLFVNPLNFSTPLGPWASAVPPLLLFAIGCGSLARRDRCALAILVLPLLLALAAGWLRLYPFHGRLTLFLVPTLLLLIAEGAGWVRRQVGDGWLWYTVVATLLLSPSLTALYHVEVPRVRHDFHPHGDNRPATLRFDRFPW